MKALVTGGAGFIGSNLIELLLERSHDVVALDNLSAGYLWNLADLPRVKFMEGDVRDSKAVDEAVDGVDVIFHMASHLAQVRSFENPFLDSEVNVLGTLRVLEAARKMRVKKIIYSSSAAVYGEATHLPIDESHSLRPESPYGISKLAAEQHCMCYSRIYDMDVICLRYFNVYGPNQRHDAYGGVTSIFATRALNNEPLVIYDDGEQTRDFVHVLDVARANLLAAEANEIRGVFNIAGGIPITVNHLAARVKDAVGKNVDIKYEPPRKGDIRHSFGDITLARTMLGYEPQVDISQGVKEYIAWVTVQTS